MGMNSKLRYYPKTERLATEEEIEKWGDDSYSAWGLRDGTLFNVFFTFDDFREMYASEDGGHTLIALWFPLEIPYRGKRKPISRKSRESSDLIEIFYMIEGTRCDTN